MPHRVNYDGEIHVFPDDFSDADIQQALASEDAAKAAAAPTPELSPVQKTLQTALKAKTGIAVPGLPAPLAALTPLGGKSAEEILDTAPGVAAGVIAPIGGPAASAAVAGLAEKGRQVVRRAAGLPAATGITQQLLGLDPNSQEAGLAGVLGEAGTAGLAGSAGRTAEKTISGVAKVGRQVVGFLESLPPELGPIRTAFSLALPRSILNALGVSISGPLGVAKAEAMGAAIETLSRSPTAKSLVLGAVEQAQRGNISKAMALFRGAASAYLADTNKEKEDRAQQLGPMVERR